MTFSTPASGKDVAGKAYDFSGLPGLGLAGSVGKQSKTALVMTATPKISCASTLVRALGSMTRVKSSLVGAHGSTTRF